MKSIKAQATTFAILGLVIVTLAITLVYFREEIFSGIGKQALQEQPTIAAIENVRSFTQNCIEESLIIGTNILGMQGGYIFLPEDEFPSAPYNVLSNSVDVFSDGNFKVPYWSYTTPNNLEKLQVPTKQVMEKQLADYVTREMLTCINDYSQFNLQGYDISYVNPETTVEIGKEAVIADVKMPLNVVFKASAQRFEKFKVTHEVPLGDLHAQAIELFEYESQKTFLENFTLDMMAMYDEVPFSGVDFECTPRAWLKSKVVQDLKNIFALNIPTLKIADTDFSLRNKKDKLLVFDALRNPQNDMKISFFFSSDWPILIDIAGENSELIRGKPFTTENEASRFLLPLFCLNDNHFVYDLKYPVLVTLTQDGYTFQYGVMSVIDNNQPKRNLVDIPQFDESPEICARADTKATFIASGIASDGSSVPMKDVDISLSCTFTECAVGQTRLETAGLALTTLVPQCIGGQLSASKSGYHKSSKIIDTNQEGTFFIDLEPYYDLPVDIIINDEGTLRAPYPTESVFFQFENKEKDYFTSYVYPSTEKLRLIAGNYKIAATLLVQVQPGFILKEEEIEICVDAPQKGLAGILGSTEKKCTKQKIDPINLDTIIAGGGAYSWFADRRILSTSNKIVLYANRGPTPQTFTELNNVYQNQEEFSKNIKKPTFE